MDTVIIDRPVKSLVIHSAAFSDPGTKRKLNQDMIFHQIGHTHDDKNVGLFLVCDGMGGPQGGEIASRIAVDIITTRLADLFISAGVSPTQGNTVASWSILSQKIKAAVAEANTEIRRFAQNHPDQTPELGTTITLVVIYDNLAYIINAGDGRVYTWRADRLMQITQDHSLAAALAQKGVIDETDIVNHPHNHIILRALGIEDSIAVDTFNWVLHEGDKLLICSDGLWKAFKDPQELAQRLAKGTTVTVLCQQLVNEAKQRDGSDNISAIVLTVSADEDC